MLCQIITGIGLASKSPTPIVQMLATCYGVAMVSWNVRDGSGDVREVPNFSLIAIFLVFFLHMNFWIYIIDQMFFFCTGQETEESTFQLCDVWFAEECFNIGQFDAVLTDDWQSDRHMPVALLDVDDDGSQHRHDGSQFPAFDYRWLAPQMSLTRLPLLPGVENHCLKTLGLCPSADGVSHFQEGYCSSQILGYQALWFLGKTNNGPTRVFLAAWDGCFFFS